MACLFCPQDVVHVENVVTILVVVSIVLAPFAWLGQDPTGISRGFILETGVAYSIARRQLSGEGMQRLLNQVRILFDAAVIPGSIH